MSDSIAQSAGIKAPKPARRPIVKNELGKATDGQIDAARWFVDQLGKNIRYVREDKVWLHFDGQR